nr:PREDICTED: SKP1-like protein 20 [Daucus carota subsp. sativus]
MYWGLSGLDCQGNISDFDMSANLVGDSSMTEDEVTVKKQDTMKSSVCIKTADGHAIQVDFEVATLCTRICNEMQSGRGYSMDNPISLPPLIRKNFLSFVINYCRYHQVSGSVYEGTTFDEILHDMDANFLYELICVAHYLQLKSLIDLTHEAMVKKIENLSSIKELYHMLHRPENVSEEEHSSWMKFFRRFFTERQKENKEKENSEKFEIVSKPRQYEDTRSIDELLAFINGGDEDDDTPLFNPRFALHYFNHAPFE